MGDILVAGCVCAFAFLVSLRATIADDLTCAAPRVPPSSPMDDGVDSPCNWVLSSDELLLLSDPTDSLLLLLLSESSFLQDDMTRVDRGHVW